MSDTAHTKLREFDGHEDEWPSFKRHFTFCIAKNCDEPLSGDKEPELVAGQDEATADDVKARKKERKEWDKNNKTVLGFLGIACEKGEANSIVSPFIASLDGRGAWVALRNHYELEELDGLVRLQEKYAMRRLEAGDNPMLFFGNLQEDWIRFDELGKPVSDKEKLLQVIAKIGPGYSQIKAFLRTTPGVTVKRVRDMVMSTYSDALAEAAATGRGTGTALPAQPRRQQRSQQQQSRQQSTQEGRVCWKCNKPGHLKADCRQGKRQQVGRTAHTNNTNPRRRQQGESRDESRVGVALVAGRGQHTKPGNKTTWMIDSGATEHITDSKKGMVNFVVKQKRIRGLGGALVISMGHGTIKGSAISISGERVPVTISNVHVIPDGADLLFIG